MTRLGFAIVATVLLATAALFAAPAASIGLRELGYPLVVQAIGSVYVVLLTVSTQLEIVRDALADEEDPR